MYERATQTRRDERGRRNTVHGRQLRSRSLLAKRRIAQCAKRTLEHLPAGTRVLIVAPHPDDDVLGCGGTIAYLHARGVHVNILYITDGTASHVGSHAYPKARLAALREDEARRGAARLGLPAHRLYFLRESDSSLAHEGPPADRLFRRISQRIAVLRPTVILSPWIRDRHSDHHATAVVLRRIARRVHLALYEYNVWPSADDVHFPAESTKTQSVQIGDYCAVKAAALAEHESQLGRVIFDAEQAFTIPKQLLDHAAATTELFHFVTFDELIPLERF